MNKLEEYISQIDKNLKFYCNSVVDGFIAGLHKSPYHGFSVEFSDHKTYSDGDPVSLIDWKLYSKTDRFYIKKYEEETNVRIYFLLDISNSMTYTSNNIRKIDYAKYLIACLVELSLRQRDATGLSLFNENLVSSLPAKSKTNWLNHILEMLEKLQCEGHTNISKAILELEKRISKRSIIVLVTDGFEIDDQLQKVMNYLKYNLHHCIVFHILDEKEFDFDFNDEADYYDLETDEHIKVSPYLYKSEYRNNILMFHKKHQQILKKLKYDYSIINTITPIHHSLKNFLLARQKKY